MLYQLSYTPAGGGRLYSEPSGMASALLVVLAPVLA